MISIVTPFRMLASFLTAFSDMRANPIAAVVGSVCCCCIEGSRKYLSFITKSAFNEVSMNGRSFREAAVAAHEVVSSESSVFRTLHGTVWIFQVAGLALGCALGAGVVLFLRVHPLFGGAPNQHMETNE